MAAAISLRPIEMALVGTMPEYTNAVYDLLKILLTPRDPKASPAAAEAMLKTAEGRTHIAAEKILLISDGKTGLLKESKEWILGQLPLTRDLTKRIQLLLISALQEAIQSKSISSSPRHQKDLNILKMQLDRFVPERIDEPENHIIEKAHQFFKYYRTTCLDAEVTPDQSCRRAALRWTDEIIARIAQAHIGTAATPLCRDEAEIFEESRRYFTLLLEGETLPAPLLMGDYQKDGKFIPDPRFPNPALKYLGNIEKAKVTFDGMSTPDVAEPVRIKEKSPSAKTAEATAGYTRLRFSTMTLKKSEHLEYGVWDCPKSRAREGLASKGLFYRELHASKD